MAFPLGFKMTKVGLAITTSDIFKMSREEDVKKGNDKITNCKKKKN
jgi:hypothetical protein